MLGGITLNAMHGVPSAREPFQEIRSLAQHEARAHVLEASCQGGIDRTAAIQWTDGGKMQEILSECHGKRGDMSCSYKSYACNIGEASVALLSFTFLRFTTGVKN